MDRPASVLPESAARGLLRSLVVVASIVEARDPYTGGHSWRVSRFCQLLGRDAGLAPRDLARVSIGGFLHDLGKVAVPDAVLRKAGPLTDDEFAVIRTHPEAGDRMLAGHPLAALVRASVLWHHERPDGRGYPHGLAGDAVPMDARIVAIADAFDAMTSTRPYRRGMPVEQAAAIVEREAGEQFDAPLARRFVALARAGGLDHVVGHSDAGIPLLDCVECGPTIVVRRAARDGDTLVCRACGWLPRLVREGDRFALADTDDHASAAELLPEVDDSLVEDLVAEASALLEDDPARGRPAATASRGAAAAPA